MTEYNPQMLSLALRYKGWTVKRLAKRLQCDDTDITGIINRYLPFTGEWAERVGFELGVPVAMFLLDCRPLRQDMLPDAEAAAIPMKLRGRVTAELELADNVMRRLESISHMDTRLGWLDEIAPHGGLDTDGIDLLADRTRELLDIPPMKVIGNTMRPFERHGVTFLPLRPLPYANMGGRTISVMQSPERMPIVGYWPVASLSFRESIIHQTAHLILHRHRTPNDPTLTEREANLFMRAFLFPATVAEHTLSPGSRMQDYLRLSAQWGVTIRTLIQRALDLNIIPQHQKDLLFEEYDKYWPYEDPIKSNGHDHPLLVKQMIGHVCGSSDTPTHSTASASMVENFLGIPFDLANQWSDGLEEDKRPMSTDLLQGLG